MKNGFIKSWGLLLVALITGIGTYFTANYFFKQHEANIRAELEAQITSTKRIVVSSREIVAGEIISADNMAVAEVPANFLPDGHIEPNMFSSMQGRELLYPLGQGKPLLDIYVGGTYAERFSDLIGLGKRPLTVEVDTINSNEGMIEVGDYVDLLLKVTNGEDEGISRLDNIAEAVRVVATGSMRSIGHGDQTGVISETGYGSGYSTITVILDSDIAAKVLLAQENGTLVTFLRNQQDKRHLGFETVSYNNLLNGSKNTIEMYSNSNNDGALLRATLFSNSTNIDQKAKPRIWTAERDMPTSQTQESEATQ